ncbi:MAG: YCF48-related protein [Actinobacteria bacterium]|nr:YCF48-related protein [Actinomycetota bacterium]
MAHTCVLDGLNLNDGVNFQLFSFYFPKPPKRTDIQPYLQGHGGSVIEGSDYYDNSVRKISVLVLAGATGNLAGLGANIQLLDKKAQLKDVVFEFKFDGAADSNYSNILVTKTADGFDFDDWQEHVRNLKVLVTLEMTAKPFWRGTKQTIALQTLSPTPAKVLCGTVLGDIETPAFFDIAGKGATSFGNNLYAGARAYPIDESAFNPIKDFSGTAEAGTTYGGLFKRQSVSTTWANITGLTIGINGVSFASAAVGWIIGEGGYVAKTTDGGATWTAQTSGVTSRLRSVQAIDLNTAFAVGDAGIILKTINGGTTWTLLTSGTTADLYALSFVSATTGWVVGNWDSVTLKSILKTTDGSTFAFQGGAWQVKLDDVLALDANIAWVCYIGNTPPNYTFNVYGTSDGGTNWTYKGAGYANGPFSLVMASTTVGWIVGKAGKIFKTTDNWATSIQQTSGTASDLNAIAKFDANTLWVVGASGIILKTINGGTNWTQQTSGTTWTLRDLSIVDVNTVFTVGDIYTILKTTNGGTTWASPMTPQGWALSSVDDYRGTYRILARVRSADATPASVQMRASSGWASGSVITNPAVNLVASAAWQWVDVGQVSIPCIPLSPEVSAQPVIMLEAKGTGAANFDIDVVVLLPVDAWAFFVKAAATPSLHVTADAEAEAVNKGYSNVAAWIGVLPMLNPGNLNNIVVMEDADGASDGIDGCDLTVKYYPRYLSPVR